jgi:hypothetical protein
VQAQFRRAAYWRQLGFPNCKAATAAPLEKRGLIRQLEGTRGLQQPSLTPRADRANK